MPWWLVLSLGAGAWRVWRGLGSSGRRALLQAGPSGLRSAQVRGVLTQGAALAGAVAGLPALAGLVSPPLPIILPGEGLAPMPHQLVVPQPTSPVIVGQVVTQGPYPVVFVKSWQAGLATFAIDSEGRRWVFRNKLGIWIISRTRFLMFIE